jgi:hypothetical protein
VQNGISMEKLEMNARAPNIISSEKSFSGRKEVVYGNKSVTLPTLAQTQTFLIKGTL